MKKILATTAAPAAIGPYSQGVDIGSLVFCSGQIPLDPSTGAFPQGIEAQTRQCLHNAQAILQQAGLTLANAVKTTVFLQDMGDFAAMNAVYEELFAGTDFPARSAVQVARLPKDALVEIEIIAAR